MVRLWFQPQICGFGASVCGSVVETPKSVVENVLGRCVYLLAGFLYFRLQNGPEKHYFCVQKL